MPERIQLRRTKGWRKPEGCISVARPSRWGNPYVVGSGEVSWAGGTVGSCVGWYDHNDNRWAELSLERGLSAVEAVLLYRRDLVGGLGDKDPYYDELRAALAQLRGHDLACWCPLDGPCHADVLLELANADAPR